jgi:GPI-anchor transamidase subunit K
MCSYEKHHADTDIGVAVIDRYTYYNLEFLEKNVDITSQHTMKDLFDSYDRTLIHSTPGIRTDLFRRPLDQVKITDFFGNVQSVEIGGEEQVIDEALLAKYDLGSQFSNVGHGSNETIYVRKRRADTHGVGGLGFEVKLKEGNLLTKVGAILVCVVLWITAKRIK